MPYIVDIDSSFCKIDPGFCNYCKNVQVFDFSCNSLFNNNTTSFITGSSKSKIKLPTLKHFVNGKTGIGNKVSNSPTGTTSTTPITGVKNLTNNTNSSNMRNRFNFVVGNRAYTVIMPQI
jgi:hypothetical protein